MERRRKFTREFKLEAVRLSDLTQALSAGAGGKGRGWKSPGVLVFRNVLPSLPCGNGIRGSSVGGNLRPGDL